MGDYITAIWGWDEQAQRDYHTHRFDPDRWQIITADGADIGMLDVEYRASEIYISRIEIHPGHQGRGIGTRFITALLSEADQQGKELILDVLAVNHRASALYQDSASKKPPDTATTTSRSRCATPAATTPDPQVLLSPPSHPMRSPTVLARALSKAISLVLRATRWTLPVAWHTDLRSRCLTGHLQASAESGSLVSSPTPHRNAEQVDAGGWHPRRTRDGDQTVPG